MKIMYIYLLLTMSLLSYVKHREGCGVELRVPIESFDTLLFRYYYVSVYFCGNS